jgi:hypothetical protein
MFVVSVTLFTFLQATQVRMLDPRAGTFAQQSVWTFESMCAFVLSQLTTYISGTESLCLYSSSQVMFCAPQGILKISDRVLVQKIFHKKCLSELIN